MMPSIVTYALLALLGFGVGIFGTLVGAGGGFILTPVLLILYPHESALTITSISLVVVFFNAASARFGRRVAFLGADLEDDAGSARALLAKQPLGYPSYPVDLGSLTGIAPIHGTPTTVFLGRGGYLAGVHPGAYESLPALEADIARYALGGTDRGA